MQARYLIILLLLFYACDSGQYFGRQQAVVDRDYLNSSAYKNFEDKASEERAKASWQRQKFIRYIKRQPCIGAGKQATSLPLSIGSDDISTVLEEKPAPSSSMTALFGSDQIYYLLAGISAGSSCQSFFLTCKIANYKSCLIWYTAKRHGELKQLQMVTAYKKTHTYTVEPEIRMDRDQIIIDVRKSTIYPLQTLSRHQIRYIKKADGTISYSSNN